MKGILLVLVMLGALAYGAAAATRTSNGLIAYVSNGDLYAVAPDGSGTHLLAHLPQGIAHSAWSPDGSRLVFAAHEAAFHSSCALRGIWVANADGAGLRRLTTACDEYPSWSPDGARIVFDRRLKWSDNRAVDTALMVMNADGTGAHRITQTAVTDKKLKKSAAWTIDTCASWSPDGSTIAYASGPSDGDFTLALVGSNGGAARILPAPAGAFDAYPGWSPDGQHLLLQRRGADVNVDPPQVVLESLDGTHATVIGTGDLDLAAQPAWSPDGTRVVFGTDGGLAIAGTDGTTVKRLPLAGGGDGFWPSWQPHG